MREPLGLTHGPQVVEVAAPEGGQPCLTLADGPQRAVLQRSLRDPQRGFLHLPEGLPAWAQLNWHEVGEAGSGPVSCRLVEGGWELDNGRMALRLVPDGSTGGSDGIHPGPVVALRRTGGRWHLATWLDTRSSTCRWSCVLEEAGPVRAVWRGRADLGGGRWYEMEATLDAGLPFARVVERGGGGRGDQVVWDLAGDDLPVRWLQTDPSPGHAAWRPHYGLDRRLARLAGWTQCSQISDLADGFAAVMADGDAVGAVALEGGAWRGNRLNQLEAWVRRFTPDHPEARRGEPPEARADLLHPDAIAARGGSCELPHLCWEGWIGPGSERRWALVAAAAAELEPPGGPGSERPCGHFDHRPDREAWAAQQGLLRRIHIRHGLAPLQDQLGWDLSPACVTPTVALRWPHPLLAALSEVARVMPPHADEAVMHDYLATRVHGFWEAAGAASSNVVVGRAIVPHLLQVEWRLATCGDSPALALARARLAFLAHLFASDHYYPGAASMGGLGEAEAMEPTLLGMANQNFLTDCLCVPGMFAEVFPTHPRATAWRERSWALWSRQLDIHLYPSGVWEESHTYFQHVLVTVLPWLLRRAAAGVGDGLADPRLRRMLAAGVRQIAPRDAGVGGRRAMVPFGDHGPDPATYGPMWAVAAAAVADSDPALAAHLAWMADGMGATRPVPLPEPVDPQLGDDHLDGLGVLLRGRGPDGGETLLALRSGGAWGHHHADDGSVMLYGAGRLLIGDAALSRNVAGDASRKFSAAGHSRWAPAGMAPRNHLLRCTRGLVVDRCLDGALPWALAWCPTVLADDGTPDGRALRHPLRHQRLVARLGPGLWLVSDAWDAPAAGEIRWHLAGLPTCNGNTASVGLGAAGRLTVQAISPSPCLAELSGADQARGDAATATVEVRFRPSGDRALTLLALGPDPLWVDGVISHGDGRWRLEWDQRQVVVDGPDGVHRLPRIASGPA